MNRDFFHFQNTVTEEEREKVRRIFKEIMNDLNIDESDIGMVIVGEKSIINQSKTIKDNIMISLVERTGSDDDYFIYAVTSSIAHELKHIQQKKSGRKMDTPKLSISRVMTWYEREARKYAYKKSNHKNNFKMKMIYILEEAVIILKNAGKLPKELLNK